MYNLSIAITNLFLPFFVSFENDVLFLETNGHSLVYSFFTRYINTISINQRPPDDSQTPEVFSIPINDKPPSYNSLFKPTTNLMARQNGLLSNQRLPSNYSNNSARLQLPNQQRRQSNNSSPSNLNLAYVTDELPPYSSVIKSNNC